MTSHVPSYLTIIDGLTMPDKPPVNSKPLKQESSSPTSAALRRRRPHTSTAWAKIRPTLKHLYIDLDMTLRDVMQRMDEEHGFRATEQMYKKRIKAWGLSKHIKADEKEKAIAKLIQNEPTAFECDPIRYDKLVRYAKSRAKSGALDSHYLSRIVKQTGHSVHKEPPLSHHTITDPTFLPRSPALPDGPAGLDLFLRAMRALIERERGEYLIAQRGPPNAIFDPLREGMAYWRSNAFAAARTSFTRAAQNVADDLSANIVKVSRITYCISSIMWGPKREPVFQMFAQFMANVARDVLGHACPLTIVLRHLQREQSTDTQVTIWACALDGYQVSGQNLDHWWNMARRRWQWCQRNGMIDLAARYCALALTEVRRINKLTSGMELEAQHDLESIVPGAGSFQTPEGLEGK